MREVKHQLNLLRFAVLNRVTESPSVLHIDYDEILQWIEDILEMLE